MLLEHKALEGYAIVLRQKGGLKVNGGLHGAMKESATLVKDMTHALENMSIHLVMEHGAGMMRDTRDVQRHLVKDQFDSITLVER